MKSLRNVITVLLSVAGALSAWTSVQARNPLAELREMPQSAAISTLKLMIKEAQADSVQSVRFFGQATEAFDGDTPETTSEPLLIPVLETFADSPWLDEAQRLRGAWRLKSALKNRPGSTFPDFTFTTPEGRVASMAQALAGKTTVVLFYDPDCSHCMETARSLAGLNLPDNWQVVAVDMATPADEVPQWPGSFPPQWIKAHPACDLEEEGLFDFRFSPTLFLTGRDGKVVEKDATVARIASIAGE